MSTFPLRCPSCHHGNPVEANFCNNCGMPVDLESCSHCDAINHRGADRCHKCGSVLSPFRELHSEPEIDPVDTLASLSDGATMLDRRTPVREAQLDSRDGAVDGRGASFAEGTEDMVGPDEMAVARPRQTVLQDFAEPVTRPAPESRQEVIARRRSPGMRAAAMGVMVVALAVPGYVAYHDPAQFREDLDAIAPKLGTSSAVPPAQSLSAPGPPQGGRPVEGRTPEASSGATTILVAGQQSQGGRPLGEGTPQASSGESIMPAQDSASPQREATPVLPMPQADSAPQPAHAANETQSPPPKTTANSKAPQVSKNVRQTRSSAKASKQGSSSRKAVAKPKAADARTRAKSADVRPAEPTEKTAGSELMP